MNLFNIEKNEIEVNMMSPLTWAYVGDAVYELYIRTHLVNKTNLKPHKLHIEAIKICKSTIPSTSFEKDRGKSYGKRKRDSKKRKKYRKSSCC